MLRLGAPVAACPPVEVQPRLQRVDLPLGAPFPSYLQAAQEASVLSVRKNELGELRKAIPLRVGMQVRRLAVPLRNWA